MRDSRPRALRTKLATAAVLFTFVGCGGNGGDGKNKCVDWPQWGQSASHTGDSCGVGAIPTQTLDDITYDPFADQVAADNFGLVVHYQSPLIVGDDLYAEVKTGTYVPCGADSPPGCGVDSWNLEIWNEVHYKIGRNGKLTKDWTFVSDWKPEPPAGFEPVFHAVVSGPYIYVPGAGGSVYKLDRQYGNIIKQLALRPTFSGQSVAARSPRTLNFGNNYVAGPITADDKGNIYFNQIRLTPGQEWSSDASGALVKITSDDEVLTVDYRTLTPGAPAGSDLCDYSFDINTYPLPWPPPLNADGSIPQPQQYACGTQRPSLNVAPAIGPDGTIYTVSHAHFNENYSYLIAVTPDLNPKWNASLRNLVNDGCGVLTPDDGDDKNGHCRLGASTGVDPNTGKQPAIAADDSASSSPVVLPDGNVIYGGLTYYNDYRGHLVKFSSDGQFLASFDFGWDVTPAVRTHDGTYSIITKDNHYGQNYANNGTYFITSLNPFLKPEWQFQSTNTKTCTRDASGAINCNDDHPNGFEWCINAPAVDRDGNIYGNSEDGNLYVLDKNGQQKAAYFLDQAIAAAYTPVALDAQGRIFALNNGHLLVLGGDSAAR